MEPHTLPGSFRRRIRRLDPYSAAPHRLLPRVPAEVNAPTPHPAELPSETHTTLSPATPPEIRPWPVSAHVPEKGLPAPARSPGYPPETCIEPRPAHNTGSLH